MEIKEEILVEKIEGESEHFPTFRSWWDWQGPLVSIIALVVVLLPALMLRIMALGKVIATQDSLAAQPTFNAATLLIGFVLAVYALVTTRHRGARMIALLTLILCLIKFLLPS